MANNLTVKVRYWDCSFLPWQGEEVHTEV